MLWILNIALAASSCEVEFKYFLDQDLRPRVSLFLSGQRGLDSLGGYEDCINKQNSTYELVQWFDKGFLYTSYGACLPSECNQQELRQILSSYATELIPSFNHTLDTIEFSKTTEAYRPEKFFFLGCFLVLIVLNIISTLFQKFFASDGKIACFNVLSNIKGLFDLSRASENLDVIDGIRSLCSFGIVLLHCEYFIMFLPVENRFEYLDRIDKFYFHLIYSLVYCVDCFFYLAGFLMAYLSVKEIQEKGDKFRWSLHIMRRIIRYLPAYLFLIGFERSLPTRYPDSIRPLLFRFFHRYNQSPWWSALIFIQNFTSDKTIIYLGWTWTICVDFQFFIISSLILYLYSKNKTYGYLFAFIIVSLSFVITFTVSYLYEVNVSIRRFAYDEFQMNLVYFKPWTRIAPYILGVVLGLIYGSNKKKTVSVAYSVKDSFGEMFEKKCLSLSKNQNLRKIFFFNGFLLIISIVLLNFCFTKYLENSSGQIIKSFFTTFHRFFIILGLSFIVFPAKLGYFTFFGNILKIKVFRITGKLSYSLYLIHMFMIIFNLQGDDDVLVYGTEFIIKFVIKIYILGLIVSVFIYVLIESPFLKLEKKIITR